MLSNASNWQRHIGSVDLKSLFYAIVELFEHEDADDEWAKNTIEWWNLYVILVDTVPRSKLT